MMSRAALLALLLVSRAAWGQTPAPRLEAGALVGSPIGDSGGLLNYSLGVLAGLEWPLDARFALTARAGFIHQVENFSESYSSWMVPVWGGAKLLFLTGGTVRPYAAVELGVNLTHSTIVLPDIGMSGSDTRADPGLNVGAGVELGPVRIQAWEAILDLGAPGRSMELMAGASYTFDVH